MMNKFDKDRSEMLGEYVVENKATVRGTAAFFGISKSTVHKDLAWKLKRVNSALYQDVKEILETNKSERHLRGGNATKQKYEKIRRNKK